MTSVTYIIRRTMAGKSIRNVDIYYYYILVVSTVVINIIINIIIV